MPRCVICDKTYDQGREMTCSDECREELIRRLIAEFGEFKKVVRESTGLAYKVPTIDIIEKGVREKELYQYPLWEETEEMAEGYEAMAAENSLLAEESLPVALEEWLDWEEIDVRKWLV